MNLRDYIRGQRQGKEANQLERKAMEDPFLQDAIDGYDSLDGNHISVIEDLEKQLSSPQKQTNKRMWIWAAAAIVILLIGLPLLFQKPFTTEETPIVSAESIQQKKDSESTLPQEDTLLVAELEITDRVPEEIITTPVRKIDSVNKGAMSFRKRDVPEEVTYKVAELNQQKRESNGIVQEVNSLEPDKKTITGRIVDESGNPLTGVAILSHNRQVGTVTDLEGNFQLTVPKEEGGTLIASFVGMKQVEIPLKENVGDIEMKADDMALNEVVVVGYGAQKKMSVVGAVSTVSSSHLRKSETFNEEEFKNYFAKNYDKHLCADQGITIVVELFIDPIGRPGQIKIKENSCPALENEIKRLLLGSPLWSKTNRKVILQIELPSESKE